MPPRATSQPHLSMPHTDELLIRICHPSSVWVFNQQPQNQIAKLRDTCSDAQHGIGLSLPLF